MRAARAVSGRVGREHALIRVLRPAYNGFLALASGGRGIEQVLNGRERFRIDPWQRMHFPATYDAGVLEFLRARVRPGDTCLNIGAHVGIYALCLAEWVGPGGHVYAFEPNPATRATLERHVALNGFNDRITVVPEAVGAAVGQATFIAAAREGYSRLGQPNPEHPDVGAPISVAVTTVDAFCARHAILPQWITMDIEGFEIGALEGARDTLVHNGGPGVVVEMHPGIWEPSGFTQARLEAVLTAAGRRARGLTGQRDALADYGIVTLEPVAGA